jgi:hypothetical protein
MPSLCGLAKDLSRLTTDSVDTSALSKIVEPATGETWRSLRHLENALATRVPPNEARRTLSPLVGIYELRLGDAHLPSGDLEEALAMAGVPSDAPPHKQAFRLLSSAVDTLQRIREIALRS